MKRHAVAGRRYSGLVWHGRDGPERFRRLRVGYNGTVGGEYAGEILVLSLARLEGAILRIVGRVVSASDAIVDVLAEVGSVGTRRIADLEAKGVAAHEAIFV